MTATLQPAKPPPMPHPRFRERRIKVRRDEGRRRLRRLVVLALVMSTVLGGLGVTRSPLLDVDRIAVAGGARTPAADVVGASGIANRQPMVEVDVEGAERRVEALPWIADAEVVRRWPGQVRIDVTERTAVAQVATTDGRWVLIDVDGRLLERVPAPVAGLVRFTKPVSGDPGDDLGRRLAASRTVAAAIEEPLDQRISDVGEAAGSVELRLTDGGRVLFGSAEQLPEKLRALEELIGTGPRWCPVWDVRVPSAPVLTPGNGCV